MIDPCLRRSLLNSGVSWSMTYLRMASRFEMLWSRSTVLKVCRGVVLGSPLQGRLS